MTIKVFLTNGNIEEYPNAHITWEWDDSTGELGTNSGWRVHSMYKNGVHVNAFIYPAECQKIEINHEESDAVFKRPEPSEDTRMLAKQYRLFSEINKERQQRGEKKLPMTDEPLEIMSHHSEYFKYLNKDNGGNNWHDILLEEVYAAFAETDPVKQRGKMIQVAAVAVQTIEYLDGGIKP